jgi:hypothetical protein
LLLVVAPSTLLRAQFDNPTKEELQMTADPAAPGAAAVYLYREETTNDNQHYHTYYERIKVLTEKGKELATIRVPYERGQFTVADIKGRTIHADGTIIPLTAKPSDLMDFKTKNLQVNTMVFTLPSVEVGSILEYRLELRYDDGFVSSPQWEVQQPYFVHKAHYSFAPSGRGEDISNSRGDRLDKLMYSDNAGGNHKMIHTASGTYVCDVTNVPPIPTDDWMPPLNSLNWRINFYYTYTDSQADFWDVESKRWAKDTDHFANPTKALKEAVGAIVAPADSDDQKAHKIYEAVMKLDNTSFTREKSEAELKKEKLRDIRDAEDVWNRKSGSANELALLYVALARAAGLQAYPMQVVNRDRAVFDPNYLSTYQLDDYISIVVVGGKEVYLDPGEARCPYGLLHWKHTIASGIRLKSSGPSLGTTPANTYLQAAEARIADLTIDAGGNVTGTIRYVLGGQDALYWRQLALKNDADEVQKQFNEAVREQIPDGVQPDFDHFLGLDDWNVNLVATVHVTGNMGTVTGKRFFMPGLFLESHVKHPFVAEDKRDTPIDVHYAKEQQDDVTYHLPQGYTVESAPQAASISWPGNAMMAIKIKPKEGGIEVVRVMAYNFTLLDSKDYSDLHDFYQKAATADQQQLVLTRTTAAQAN